MSAHAQWPPPIHWSGHSEVGRHETFTRRNCKRKTGACTVCSQGIRFYYYWTIGQCIQGQIMNSKVPKKHQITKQSEGIEICLGDVWMGLIWSTVKYWGDQIIGVETESWCNPVWDLVHPLLPKSDKCVIWRVSAVWHRGGHQPPKRVLSPNFRGMWSSRHFNSTCPECVMYL